ncbi:hypothetical protein FG379_002073 [Cryptosporidium bovis]|uniref:uncharacterized protein n=1 Tax=Cryptosporidium bovis TaxID=310047 RepID=UPI00351A14B2|nr:hypothetical protein FG379_002073 [Cryptosporidium bovis]
MRNCNLFLAIFLILVIGFDEIYSDDVQQNQDRGIGSVKSRIGNMFKFKTPSRPKLKLSFGRGREKKKTENLEELFSELEEVKQKRQKTRNPFLKLRYYLGEQKIKKTIRKIKKSKDEEKKLEKLEEELPMDYSPQALPKEGSVPPYLPVVLELPKGPIEAHDYFGEEDKPEDKVLLDEGHELQITVKDMDQEEEEDGLETASGHETTEMFGEKSTSSEQVDEVGVDVSESEDEAEIRDGLGDSESEQPEEIDIVGAEGEIGTEAGEEDEEGAKKQDSSPEKGVEVKKKTKKPKLGGLFGFFKARKESKATKLAKLLVLREKLEIELAETKNSLRKRILAHKLKRTEKSIQKLTEEAIDEIEGKDDTQDDSESKNQSETEIDQ